MVVAEGGECPTPCKKKEGGIVWEGEMYMGNISRGNVRIHMYYAMGHRSQRVGHGLQLRWATELWVIRLDPLPALNSPWSHSSRQRLSPLYHITGPFIFVHPTLHRCGLHTQTGSNVAAAAAEATEVDNTRFMSCSLWCRPLRGWPYALHPVRPSRPQL